MAICKWLLLLCAMVSGERLSNTTPRFNYLAYPLERCLEEMFGTSQNMPGIPIVQIMHMMKCIDFYHRTKMKCQTKHHKPRLIEFRGRISDYGWYYKAPDWPNETLTTPCGHIGISARAHYVHCIWYVRVPFSLTINATFTYFNIPEVTLNCMKDRMQITTAQQNYTQRFCGKRLPFNIIPYFSTIDIEFHISWRLYLVSDLSGFRMFYQVIDKNKHLAHGKGDFENIESNTSLVYQFSHDYHIKFCDTHHIYSLHFHADIGYFITVTVSGKSQLNTTILKSFDGPSAVCHLLKVFQLSGENEMSTSFGTSLLLLLQSASMTPDEITITFVRSLHKIQFPSAFNVTKSKRNLQLEIKESEFCTSTHSILFCELDLELPTGFIKLENIFIQMDIPYIFDCNFGSVWIFDSMSPQHIWKWCGFKRSHLQELTRASNKIVIKLILYNVSDTPSAISFEYSESACIGVFFSHPDLLNRIPHIAKTTLNYIFTTIHITKLPRQCCIVQSFRTRILKRMYMHIKGRDSEVNEYVIVRTSYTSIPDCSDKWKITVTVFFSHTRYGDANFFSSFRNDPSWGRVSFRAMHVSATYDDYLECGDDEGFIMAVQDGCKDLFTDDTLFHKISLQPPEFSRSIHLRSGCEKFITSVTRYQTFQFAIDDTLLCSPLTTGSSFPCISEQGVVCESLSNCALKLDVQMAVKDRPCTSSGYYVDILNLDRTVRLRWHVHAKKSMVFLMHLHTNNRYMSNAHMHVTSYDDKTTSFCDFEVQQILVKYDLPVPHPSTTKVKLSSNCLVRRTYLDSNDRHAVYCFKWGMSPEWLSMDGESYIRVNSSDLSWLEAEDFCHSHNGHLVSITSQKEEELVKSIFDSGPTLRPTTIYIGLHFNKKRSKVLQWVDNRPVSFMSWNNVFIKGQSPVKMSRTHTYPRNAFEMRTLSYQQISQSLVAIVSNLLQPIFFQTEPQCGYLIVTTLQTGSDWFMGPCDQRTNPGAFLCSLNRSRTHSPTPNREISFEYNSVKVNHICPDEWITLQHGCVILQDQTKNCPSDKPILAGNESFGQELQNWLACYRSHDSFHCKLLAYHDKTGQRETVHNASSSSDGGEECRLCTTVIQDVSQCPHGLFQCDDKTCIAPGTICDGKFDCRYGEDEAKCHLTMCHINNIYQNQTFCLKTCSVNTHNCLCGLDFWQCRAGGCIPITKYCDYQQDCGDASDEDTCDRPQCTREQDACRNTQCVASTDVFNLQQNCLDNSDENDHKLSYQHVKTFECDGIHIAAIRLDDLVPDCIEANDEYLYQRLVSVEDYSPKSDCLPGFLPCLKHHTRCFASNKLCMYELDIEHQMMHCRNGYHIKNCEDFPCSRSFKCPSSYCIPLHYLCDGTWHCPNGEDEQLCNVTITHLCQPKHARKTGFNLPPYVYSILNGSCISAIVPKQEESALTNLLSCPGLFHCLFGQCLHPSLLCDGIVHCPLFADDETSCVPEVCPTNCTCIGKTVHCSHTHHKILPSLPGDTHVLVFRYNNFTMNIYNLAIYTALLKLDLSFNGIDSLPDYELHTLVKLLHLDLSHNKFIALPSLHTARSLVFLNLSHNLIRFFPRDSFQYTSALKFFDMSSNKLYHLQSESFGNIKAFKILSMGNNSIVSFDQSLFQFFQTIDVLISDKYQHCCLAETVGTYSSTHDGFSTCKSLLAKPSIKGIVYLVGLVGITANSYVIFNRIKYKKTHSVLIVNLAVSDAGYSLYLTAVGVADAYFAGAYILHDDWWRNSFLCKTMSFMSVFAYELSIAVLMCISIERYINICSISPIRLHTDIKLPWLMLPIAWCVAILISLLPVLLSWYFGESFSPTNSICIFLDMSGTSAYKTLYLTCVQVVANGLCFLTILVMYVHIVRVHIKSSKRVGRKMNLNLFKRTLLIVVTNFLCWAPVTGFVLFSYNGMAPSSEFAVWMAIVVLPINSAANPVLYTLSAACKPAKKKR